MEEVTSSMTIAVIVDILLVMKWILCREKSKSKAEGRKSFHFFVLRPNVFYAIISVSGPLGGKSYIRTLDTMIFSLGYRFNPRAKPSG